MNMTADEICRSYKNAVDPKKQVGILAELNATDKASIKAILIDAGLMEPDGKSGPKTKAEMNAVIAKGLQEGLSIGKIAEAAGCSRTTVKNRKREQDKPQTMEKPQTAEELDTVIAKGVREGLSVREIAAKAGCAENTVRRWMRKMERDDGWEAPKTEEEKEERITEGIRKGLSVREIAEQAGCAENTVRRRLERPEAQEKPRMPVRGSIPGSARVAAVIHAIPENAGSSVKLKAFDLCRALLESEAL